MAEEEKHWADCSDGPKFTATDVRDKRVKTQLGYEECKRLLIKEWMEVALSCSDPDVVPAEVCARNIRAVLIRLVEIS